GEYSFAVESPAAMILNPSSFLGSSLMSVMICPRNGNCMPILTPTLGRRRRPRPICLFTIANRAYSEKGLEAIGLGFPFPMICFVCTAAHNYTFDRLLAFAGLPKVKVWTYDRLFRARSLPRATWIFTDFDRLNFWELELAARFHRNLVGAQQTVLNDPATVAQRFSLLRRLH